ncbi:MAG: aldo/keto reductase [Acidimicrobiia bacterium]|nr:aldo/keto reductase [Acidimicrobiia bacterium]
MRYTDAPLIPESMSVVGFGCWPLSGPGVWSDYSEAAAIESVRLAVDLGVNFFDVAPVYGLGHAEEVLGRALANRRDEVLIASKFGLVWDEHDQVSNNGSGPSIRAELEASLRRLGTDRIDVYQMHWPDPGCDIDETMATVLDLQADGEIRYIGLSNFSIAEMEQARLSGSVATFQGLYNLLEHNPDAYHGIPLEYRSRSEVLPYVADAGMAFLPYSPLLQGLLTEAGYDAVAVDASDVRHANPKLAGPDAPVYVAAAADLRALAADMGRPLSQVAINWLAAQAGMGPVIAGSYTADQVEHNAGAGDWELTTDELGAIDRVLGRHPKLA